MDRVIIEVESNLQEIERFFACLDKVSSHVYGLIKTAMVEVRGRLDCHYQIVKYFWSNEGTRKEVIKAAQNSLGNVQVPKGKKFVINFFYISIIKILRAH